ncbi:hypothetical protein RD110_12325 [Rhodoferax koreense]|uniref:TonB-dependent receptor n=2 Tax=Rhodoferax koreensis TaxID=1842727 RepID=A0A1P8K3Z2_9BURK|nr:hypothetical protein RD110_12325 [Rhodoferax koreense]
MKILDYALLTLFSSASPLAWAQQTTTPAVPAVPVADAAAGAPECSATDCRSGEDLLFQLQTHGERDPATHGTSERSGSKALEPDRRVSIEAGAAPPAQQPGVATATGKFSLQLPNGGIVWATEDPTLGVAELSVSGPSQVAFENGRIIAPVQFFLRSNYPGFIQRIELGIYRATDTDLTEPLASMPMPVAGVSRADWNGVMAPRFPLRAGDDLIYIVRAYGADGAFDETMPRTLSLVRREEAERGASLTRDQVEKTLGTAMTTQQAETQSLLSNVFSGNGLRRQNIPIYGSRIRIQGRNLPLDHNLQINGQDYPVDLDRKFVAEFLEPVGSHSYDLVLKDGNSQTVLTHTMRVEVSGNYFFGVAMADLTVFQNKATGPGMGLALNGRTDSLLVDGRLAFYGKTKIDGKYLVTAQADTQERDIRDLFSGFTHADPTDVFRRLDPNQYYPVYGDDSTTYRDVDTQGRFYLRVDWDKNQALWGNFATGFTGTQYAQYVRSLYGAAVNWRARETNPWGETKAFVRAFASEARTAPGHSEFIGTGGSLYYLRHTDVLPGSDIVTLEVRNPTTGNVESRSTLVRGTDYTINETQGRILLTKALAQVAGDSNAITRDTPLAGNEQRLLVDYEWIPSGFDAGNLTAGARGKQWVTDHVAIGGTVVNEKQSGDNYTLRGVDLTLQAGRGTFLKLEHTETESTGAPVFFSSNGGLSFTQTNATTGHRAGSADALDAQANLKEMGWTDRNWTLSGWRRRVDAGYSVARNDTGQDLRETGLTVRGEVSDTLSIYALASRVERGAESLDQAQFTAQWRPTDDDTVSAEIRRITQNLATGDVNGTLGAAKYTRRVSPNLDVYGIAQKTLDNDDGRYPDNDAYTVGAKYRFANLSSVGAETTHGDRGNSTQVNAEYRLSADHTVYGTFTASSDGTEYDSVFNPRQQGGWTLGQRWRLTDKTNLFNESQYLKDPNTGKGLANTFGMDFYPAVGWNFGFTLQQGELTSSQGDVHRRAVSVTGGHTTPQTTWSSKAEWRRDTGAEQRTQWVLANRIDHKVNESWRVSGKLNHSDTDDKLNAAAGARYTEAVAGFAWRPLDATRYALLGRYTHLYDLASLGQVNQVGSEYDQKSDIVSIEGIYKYDRQWEFAAKLARREGSARFGRGTGQWFDSATTYAGFQTRYELPDKWHGLVEFRTLAVKQGGARHGWLAGIDRDITKNLRVGIGYNFTSFSDDLTKLGYTYKGFFLNIVGYY